MWGALKQTYRTEGKWGLFAPYAPGWAAKMVDAGSFNFVFWFWYTVVTFVAERIGNNAGLVRALKFTKPKPFFEERGQCNGLRVTTRLCRDLLAARIAGAAYLR